MHPLFLKNLAIMFTISVSICNALQLPQLNKRTGRYSFSMQTKVAHRMCKLQRAKMIPGLSIAIVGLSDEISIRTPKGRSGDTSDGDSPESDADSGSAPLLYSDLCQSPSSEECPYTCGVENKICGGMCIPNMAQCCHSSNTSSEYCPAGNFCKRLDHGLSPIVKCCPVNKPSCEDGDDEMTTSLAGTASPQRRNEAVKRYVGLHIVYASALMVTCIIAFM